MRNPSRRNPSLSRRRIVQGLGAALGTGILGCKGSAGALIDLADGGAGGSQDDYDADHGGLPDADGNGATTPPPPEDLLQQIDTYVILCMENHSFDNYFGSLLLRE